jgi:hypothetical protein
LPGARIDLRLRTAATWLFVLSLFAAGVHGVVKAELGGLAVLAVAAFFVPGGLRPRALERAYLVFAALALVVIAYMAFGHWPAYQGSTRSYDGRAVVFVITYTAVAVFGALFFEEALFARVTWRAATLALWAGVITCTFSRLTGHALAVNPDDGALRMIGTLTEPSDWAPVLTLILLLALRRRSPLYVALVLAGMLLADSPTCILVMAVSVPLYYALTGQGRQRVLLLAALAVLIPAGAFFITHANAQAWQESRSATEVAAGRLVSGIRNVATDGQQGSNDRYKETLGVVQAVRANGWMRLGAGPGADAVYFRAVQPAGSAVMAGVNALWVSVLADFGETGVAVLGTLMITAAWRMRRFPESAAILLPLFTASLVNQAVPEWSFTALGIMLFTCGWAARPALLPQRIAEGPAITAQRRREASG